MITIKEYFNEAKLRYIYDNYTNLFPNEKENNQKEEFNKFNKFNKKLFLYNTAIKTILDTSKDGVFEAKYQQKNGQGRYYAEKSIGLCNLTRKIRHTITCDYSVDIDIKNSSPSILYNLLQKENEKLIGNNKFKYQNLENYIKHRDDFLHSICDIKNIDRKDAKALVVAVINNKYIPKKELISYSPNFVNFYWEMYHIRNKLAIVFADLYEKTKKEKDEKLGLKTEDDEDDENDLEISEDEEEQKEVIKKEKKINYMGSFMTKLLFNYENEIIMNCLNVFKEKNIAVHGLQFDGFPFDKNHKNDELLELCKKEVFEKMGFHIEFDFKELDEIIEINQIDLEPYIFDIEYLKYVGSDPNKRSIQEILERIDDNILLLFHFNIIIKTCFNLLQDLGGTLMFIKKWFKKSIKKYYENGEKMKEMIEFYSINASIQDKKLNLNALLKIYKEVESQKKKNEKIKKISEKENKQKLILKNNLLKTEENTYEEIKSVFEKNNMIIGGNIVYENNNGKLEFFCYNQAKIRYMNLFYYEYNEEKEKVYKKLFLEQWLQDPGRRQYLNVDFVPNINKCSSETYNLFKGFNAEKYNPGYEMTEEEILLKIEPIIVHINYLTSGYADYLLKWFAFIIQNPGNKTQIAPLIRDQGEIFSEGGGTGKNKYFEYFGNKILGSQYFHVISDNKELYNQFNSQLEGKLFILVEETNSKDNHTNQDPLKSSITKNTLNVNRKNVAQYTVNDYSNFIFCSNNKNPLPIKIGNRRHAVFDTNPIKRGDLEYFKKLHSVMEDNLTSWAFYQYLLNLETYKTQIEFSINIPDTQAYLEIRRLNAPLHLKWILSMVKEKKLENSSMSELYKKFCEWCKKNHESKDEQIMSLTAFGLLINNNIVNPCTEGTNINENANSYDIKNIGEKKKSYGIMIMNWKIENVINGLKKIYLLENNFVY